METKEAKYTSITLIIFTIIMLLMALSCGECKAQELTFSGNTFKEVSKPKEKAPQEKTPYTYEDKKGKTYPIYINKNGSCYIIRVSQKTGDEYKKYLKPEDSKKICAKLNREYKPRRKSE